MEAFSRARRIEETAHLIINVPASLWIDPATEVSSTRLGLFSIVYVLSVVYLASLWRSPRRQSLHDKATGAVVTWEKSR